MAEQECQQVYQELVAMLQEFRLGGIVEQVKAKIHAGELSEDLAVQPGVNTAQAALVKPENSTAQAQLLRLIGAVERILVGSIELEGALVDSLVEESKRSQSSMTLSFESESSPLLTS
ncbi:MULTISPECIES: hypothetical protein [Leptolyngbya]|uniref:hypothetical protein n=1 Tax=Leptolyngbya TaxID=47251 RepID=UPI0016877066|nr:hypothetical protein [Leptolyngbya sp. FACHB-1624]MBD1858037.1 hypothetical protein [Leptolyngbya sp. FACHB-1624]